MQRMNKFDAAMESIKAIDDVERGRNYDRMGWRNQANKWALTRIAKAVELNHSL